MVEPRKGISITAEVHTIVNERRLELNKESKLDMSMSDTAEYLIRMGWLADTCDAAGCNKKASFNYPDIRINDVIIGEIMLCREHSQIFGVKYFRNDGDGMEEFERELKELDEKKVEPKIKKKEPEINPVTGRHKFHYIRKEKPE